MNTNAGYPEETYPEYDEPCLRRGFKTVKLEEPPTQPTAEALAERMEQEEEEVMARKLSIVREEEEEEEDEEEEDTEAQDDEDEEEEEEEEGLEEAMGVEEDIDEEEEEEEEAEKRQLLRPPSSQPGPERTTTRIGLEAKKELQCNNSGKKQISFSEHKDVFHYPKEDTYEDGQEDKEDQMEEEDEDTEVEEEEEADEDDPVMEAESLQFSCDGSSNPEEEAGGHRRQYFNVSKRGGGGSNLCRHTQGSRGERPEDAGQEGDIRTFPASEMHLKTDSELRLVLLLLPYMFKP